MKKNRRFVDLQEMPGFNPSVPNGRDSVSRGVVFTKVIDGIPYPYHVKYGALLKVSPDGIWRCPVTNEGCYETC